ncbi:hypothetical protein [Streptomyces sp. NPDC018711]
MRPGGGSFLDRTVIAALSVLTVTGRYTSGRFDGWYAPSPPLGW